ncbi:DUF4149 domain-containing protein [Nodularia sphaerocarpa]|uniref:DUF4149 domain-containing protein n=1 Tax=Nodularia sphaerocarpa TaxID=137816 RepID=UPI001EFBBC4E|nr:DUF4149 domain-containing protein [Nodularia sphaerocarpa]MDB9373438.1 DUF4149 domain-containing protein [Nodularia sphaerocarpa CS-585]MDB9379775.1 DUF4149 domain-containing protein [Nodularia sphaerocarpa CS-585A2]ULP74048.1 hypothetical protein BDGGKGIB_03708 [Nodularia sphaerocarpa UHCC 0038]
MNAISTVEFKRLNWQTAIMFALGFWLSASLVLDWVIMPSLYLSGMMSQTDFTTAGYVIFWNFNRMELLSAAVVLTGVLAVSKTTSRWNAKVILFALMLLAITLLNTFFLTPQMCAVGTHLNLFETASTIPAQMNLLHSSYFVLEAVKILAAGTLLSWCWREQV